MRRTLAALLFVAAAPLFAQEEKPQPATMGFEEYDPKSTLVVPQNPRTKAKFPFIDVHTASTGARSRTEGAVSRARGAGEPPRDLSSRA